jgi:FkbM family methyltransferase
MLKSYLKKIISLFPTFVQNSIWSFWHFISPPKIWLYDFEPLGCVFEAPTQMERYRVSELGDEREFIAKALNTLKSSDVFFDIGANLGLYAIHAAKRGVKVFAFEPDPGYRKRLTKNIKLNKSTDKIKVVAWAVSDKEDSVQLFTDGVDGISPSLIPVGERKSIAVKTNSLDRAISNRELPFPTVLKIDIEGAEVLALKGMSNLLKSANAPRYIFVELHPVFLSELRSSVDECKQLLVSFGYEEESSIARSNQLHSIYKKML